MGNKCLVRFIPFLVLFKEEKNLVDLCLNVNMK